MPFQVSPGIVVTERDLTTVVPNVATSIGALAGAFQWGPVMERITVTSENELIKTFGKPTDHTFQHVLSAANYLAYANNLIVVRNVGPVAKNAAVGDIVDGTNKLVKNKDDYDASSFTDQVFIAKYPGTLGNSLKAIAIDSIGWGVAASAVTGNSATADQKAFISHFNGSPGTSTDVAKVNGSNDEIHILVIDEGGQFTGTAGQVLSTDGTNLNFITLSTQTLSGDISGSLGNTQIGENTVGITELMVTDGQPNTYLKTDGSGNLSFGTINVTGATTGFAVAMSIALG